VNVSQLGTFHLGVAKSLEVPSGTSEYSPAIHRGVRTAWTKKGGEGGGSLASPGINPWAIFICSFGTLAFRNRGCKNGLEVKP